MQLFFHGFNLLFVSSFESEDRGPMRSHAVIDLIDIFYLLITFLYSDLKATSN